MIIKVNSHRARQKVENILGYLPQGYFSFYKTGEWREIKDEEFELIKNIKGITKSKLPEKAMEYWKWS